MDSTSSRVRAMAGSRDDDDARSNYPKHHPSAIGFPSCWDHEMSCCLAEFDAFDGVDHRVTIRKLKDKFPLLRRVSDRRRHLQRWSYDPKLYLNLMLTLLLACNTHRHDGASC